MALGEMALIFYDEKFPYAGVRPGADDLARMKEGGSRIVSAAELAEALSGGGARPDSFVTLHGPYFPKDAWSSLLAYLRSGGGLVLIGGAPFKTPVYAEGGEWIAEREQTAYHRKLLIHEALPVDGSRYASLRANGDVPLLRGREALFEAAADTYGLVLHVTRSKDMPHELGSAGPMDAVIHPLLLGLSAEGRETAAPAVLLEHAKGEYAGGRWVLAHVPVGPSFWRGGGAEALLEWASYAGRGMTELWLKPSYGCYEPGEQAALTLQAQRIREAAPAEKWSLRIVVKRDGTELWRHATALEASRTIRFERLAVPGAVAPGFYEIECVAAPEGAPERFARVLRQGYWGMDRELLREGEPLTVGRDYFIKNGRPFPIVGMTYMTSDVARKFLFLPNAGAWDRDMAQMKKAGINYIRTGVWTAWRHIMFADGHASEEVMRAIDAFVLTAKKHGLELTFNFFAFAPEAWEGANPYLDPRAVEAQRRFIAAVVSRHRDSTHVHWDLINEPSMFDPRRIFSGPRTAGDRFEREAYVAWLRERHGGSIRRLQERWNLSPEELPSFEAARPPESSDINFDVQDMARAKKGLVWLDYSLFTMEMHNRWARQLTETIREIAPAQLVTVGQDEGLAGDRPSPFFYAEAVDYTTVHTWWKMDQLVWDSIFAKDGLKPTLVQETGIMYVETPDGRAKRSEEELRNILERKYAYAFSTGGAGAVQWIWNTNFYMDNVNESNIGTLRADGTEKPEADVSYDFGAFMASVGDRFSDRRLEDVAVVYPYSNALSNRKLAFDATGRLTRVLAYEMNVPFRGVSEYHLDRVAEPGPRLWIVPSAHNFSDEALQSLTERVGREGGTLLMTGPVRLDAYWGTAARLREVIGETRLENVLREETLLVDGARHAVSFGGSRIAELAKERPVGGADEALALRAYPLGRGTLLWCPLPIELNERGEAMRAVYEHALRMAGIAAELVWERGGDLAGLYGRKLRFADGALYVFVSEYGEDADVAVADPDTGKRYAFTVKRERSVLFFANADGAVEAVYRPQEHTIRVEA